MPEYLSFDALMKMPVAERVEQDFGITGWGTVRIRALSSGEYWRGQESAKEKGEFNFERWQAIVISLGMVNPCMSYDDALRFARERPYGVVDMLVRAIVGLTMRVPGNLEDAVDAAEASFQG